MDLKAQYEAYRQHETNRSYREEEAIILPTYEHWLEAKIEVIKDIVGRTAMLSNPHKYIEANLELYHLLWGNDTAHAERTDAKAEGG